MPRGGVLIAYASLRWPWQATITDHLDSFARHGSHRYSYVNLAVPGLGRLNAALSYDAVVWHTSLLGMLRWAPPEQHAGLLKRSRALRDRATVHVALPQDEFLQSDRINEFLAEIGTDHVFSVAPESEWPEIYSGLKGASISRVLTGYLDDATTRRIDGVLTEHRPRTIDIGYRTVPGKPFLGRHAMLKSDIADAVREGAQARGLTTDVSTRGEDTFYGDDWYRFLASCRYTIGMEGGASILDRDGSVRRCVDETLERRPGASFEELEASCFPGRDGELALFALSPRHLEACATRTAQILVEGEYGGILRPGEHYLAIRPDLSNLDEVLDRIAAERALAEELSERAHRDVVAPGEWTYRRLVADVERELPPPAGNAVITAASRMADRASRRLIPLAQNVLMPARRRVLGLAGRGGYDRQGRPLQDPR